MASTARPSPRNRPGGGSSRTAQRHVAAERAAAERRRIERRRRRIRWGGMAGLGLALLATAVLLATRGDDRAAGRDGQAVSGLPEVGGDLHTVTTVGDSLYVGGHAAVAVSRDGGRRWQPVPSLDGADAMGWAVITDAVLAGGHPGLYRSTDGATFTAVTGEAAVPDVHALGGAGRTVYLASPQAGLLASTDGGKTWQVRNRQVGRSFMGTMLVDPANTKHLVAPDMSGGIAASTDGGRTWTALGGPTGAMAVTWKPTKTNEMIAVGMNGGARSTDGGATWQPVELPQGTSALSYDSSGGTLYAGVLVDSRAQTYRSRDDGATWKPTG